jgi:P-type Cu+ transporter
MHWAPVPSAGLKINDELYAGDTGLEGVCADGVTKRRYSGHGHERH